MSNSRLVYSSGDGDHRRDDANTEPPEPPSDGIVRISREKARRGGKTVTVIRGLPRGDVSAVATALKRLCGSGGTVKDGAIEIQGDHVERIAARLEADGHRVRGG